MRLTLSVYVSVEREEGRSVFVCRPLRGQQIVTRDPLLSQALSKLGNKMRKAINGWIEMGASSRISPWLYDAGTQAKTVKLTLVLRDRTLRWKLLLVCLPAFGRQLVFSPSIPDTAFEVDNLIDLESRAIEVYTAWATEQITDETEDLLDGIGQAGDMWIEPIETEVETAVQSKKRSKNKLAALFGGGKTSGSDELYRVGHCLDELAADYETAIGRQAIVGEIDRLLQREDRQGVLIVGPPAVGKTAIVHECVRRRVHRMRKRRDNRSQVWWLSPQRLISGMSYLGQWEQRWLAILREAWRRDHVLYFDDLVGLYSAGKTRDSSLSAADVLRGFVAEHPVRILAELTAEQLAVLRRRDRALADRFHLTYVPSLVADDALPIALAAAHAIERRSGRFFHPQTLPLVMQHQESFAPDRAFPGKAIEMCKTLSKHATLVVDRKSVIRLAEAQAGTQRLLLLNQLGDQAAIQQKLGMQLIGQPEAVAALSRTVSRYSQQLHPPDRPLGVLLLLGPTGVGKTEAAKALTRLLYVDSEHLVRLDMNELNTPLAAEQLVGTFDQPEGRLTSAVRRQPNCVILLDEIEKAHPDVFDYLLQVLGEGRLTDARGRVADFRSTIIVMTSNLGASEQNASVGFEVSSERRQQIYLRAAQQFFRPEFFNRIDDVVAFRNLAAEDMEQIVAIQMNQVLSRDGIRRRNVFVRVAPAAIRQVIRRGFDSKLGARAVRRMLESEVIGPLGDCLSELEVDHPAFVYITHQSPQTQLRCQVRPLRLAQPRTEHPLEDLQELVAKSRELYGRLDERLGELQPELLDVDRALTGQTHGASYYALREQLHRCSELLKAVVDGVRHGTRGDSRPQLTPVSKPRRGPDGVGVRRGLKELQAQEELLWAMKEPNGDGLAPQRGIARQLRDGLTVAARMIDAAQTPRSWLVGVEMLTQDQDGCRIDRPVNRSDEEARFSHIWESLYFQPDMLIRCLHCLQHHWQYELSHGPVAGGFWLVSGVSLLGILQPLLGTYRLNLSAGASHLQVLRAIAVEDVDPDHFSDILATDSLLDEQGNLRTPPEQPRPTEVVRGVIDGDVVDLISGSRLGLSPQEWDSIEKGEAATARWWLDCLPTPRDLLRLE